MAITIDGTTNQVKDTNGNEVLEMAPTSSAVNYLAVVNSATGQAVDIQAKGDDAAVGIKLTPKSTGGVVIGSGGTAIQKILSGSTTVDLASIADGDDGSANVTVTGAAVGDPCFAGLTTLTTEDVLITAKVSATDTVEVTFLNRSGGAFDAASGTLRAVVFKFS